MTYQQVEQLFRKFRKGSTWPGDSPRVFCFHRDGGEEYTVDLNDDDGKARYLRVLFSDVRPNVEQTGETDSQNVYYRLKRATR